MSSEETKKKNSVENEPNDVTESLAKIKIETKQDDIIEIKHESSSKGLIDYNQGWKSSTRKYINDILKNSKAIDCVALGYDEGSCILTPALIKICGYNRLRVKLEDLIQREKVVKWVSVGESNAYCVLFGRNGWASNGCESLIKKLNEISDLRQEIKCVALGPEETFVVLYGENGYATNANSVKDKLMELNNKKCKLQGVALGPDDSYVIWFDGYCFSAKCSKKLNDALEKVHDQKLSIDCVTLGPGDSYVLIYGKKQY